MISSIKSTGLIAAVIYARMSSLRQDKSIEDQVTAITAFAAKEGYRIVRVYADHGISGNDDSREEFTSLIRDAQNARDFDVILCWDQDRFSRFDSLKANHFFYVLRECGVQIVTVNQGLIDFSSIQGQLLTTITQHGSHDFLQKLSKGVCRGKTSSAKIGRWQGRRPFGYRLPEKKSDEDRRHGTGALTVCPQEAPLLKWLIDAIGSNVLPSTIARELNAKGVLTTQGHKWNQAAVKDVARNEVCLGKLIYGRKAAGKFNRVLGGETISVDQNMPCTSRQSKSDCVIVEGAHEPIVTVEAFELAQKAIAARTIKGSKPRSNEFVLTGVLRCGHCQSRMCGNHNKYSRNYACYKKKHCTDCPDTCRSLIRADYLEEKIIAEIELTYFSDAAIEAYRLGVVRDQQERRKGHASRDKSIRKKLATTQSKLDAAEQRVLEAPEDMVSLLYKKIRELREQKAAFEIDLARDAQTSGRTEEAVADEARQTVSMLREVRGLLRSPNKEIVKAILTQVIDRVELFTKPIVGRPTDYQGRFDHKRLRQYSHTRIALSSTPYRLDGVVALARESGAATGNPVVKKQRTGSKRAGDNAAATSEDDSDSILSPVGSISTAIGIEQSKRLMLRGKQFAANRDNFGSRLGKSAHIVLVDAGIYIRELGQEVLIVSVESDQPKPRGDAPVRRPR